MSYDEKTALRVRTILSRRGDVVEKNLMGGLAFLIAGNMACSISGKGGLLVRVGADAYQRTLQEPHVQPMRMGARTMSGFVRIDPEGYRSEASLEKWLQRGVDFAATLPAKNNNSTSTEKKSYRGNTRRP